ncbi:hypothetical protein MPTK1_4g19530 [Marchantia polymorpha subsp. ruderalis]|uniref:Pathogen-related protein n=2 Tax=Marchantia polymorpha TaxID=3197 RepID=A0A176VDQ5_MARPO|nr:hypothetical protein AXG93_2623s1010 [Marchantia polymorpha subsp. ruderalis]PTQ30339.1 hypothetical protein MARPO_0126s0041 [Marchantia polymorpha]BBN09403.1 hypothetical protein Mp_4g19530 [Marchantia polymorpha subsp. ruderalis]|eukprot:PTQ30339.1 hypothetical protein MARPO_0126s0041 [Marchantia polymorpha]
MADHSPAAGGVIGETAKSLSDPFRSYLYGESEAHTAWRHGGPPVYDAVNAVFEKGRTQEWKEGSLEYVVQNLVKTWEMELSHKTRVADFKTIDPEKFRISVNGGPKLTAEETLQVGSYNALMASSLPGEHEAYKASVETFESSHEIFRSVFPDGFAWEVLAVYSGPPVVAFKWRHWGVMKAGFKGHAPTNDIASSVGICIAKVDDNLRITELEVHYDPTAFLADLTKGTKSPAYGEYKKGIEGCPYLSSLMS